LGHAHGVVKRDGGHRHKVPKNFVSVAVFRNVVESLNKRCPCCLLVDAHCFSFRKDVHAPVFNQHNALIKKYRSSAFIPIMRKTRLPWSPFLLLTSVLKSE
jgi:hypothetical protein